MSRFITLEFYKPSEKLPDTSDPNRDPRVLIQINGTLEGAYFIGKSFDRDSEYIADVDEVDYWAYLPDTIDGKVQG